jgi:hypothetical protein
MYMEGSVGCAVLNHDESLVIMMMVLHLSTPHAPINV